MGIIKAGGVAVLVNFSMVEKDILYLLKMTDTQFLVYGDNKLIDKNPDAAAHIASELGIAENHLFNIRPDYEDLTVIENRGNEVN